MQTLILAIDTTQSTGSLALSRNGQVLEEIEIHAPEGFSSVVYGELARLLERHNVTLPEIDAYGVAAGPGSFTGVRIGLTVAKGLAEMHGKLVVPVSNLRAIAALVPRQDRPLAPIIDVRRGEIAGAVYTPDLTELLAPFSAEPPEFTRRAAQFGDILYCGADAPRFFPDALATPSAIAGAIARLASRGGGVDPAAADAEYVRRADIGPPIA